MAEPPNGALAAALVSDGAVVEPVSGAAAVVPVAYGVAVAACARDDGAAEAADGRDDEAAVVACARDDGVEEAA